MDDLVMKEMAALAAEKQAAAARPADLVAKNVDPEANIIFGTVVDESLGDQVRVTVIATGFNDSNVQQTLPSMTMPVARPAAPVRPVAPQPAPAPIRVKAA